MAHSYFGDAIVCRDYSQAWLKESWAVYMEHCYIEDHLSAEDYNYNFYLDSHNYFAEADGSYKRPIVTRNFNSSWQMYDRHLYPGGACRIHTLRNEIGDEAFWAATKEYVKTFHKKVVETDDFRKLLEKHSGRSLGRLFDQWFFKADYPNLKIKFDFNAESKLGCFEIEQTQAKGKDEEAFYLSIDLAWVFKGNLITKSVKLNKAKQSFMFPMEKDPEQLRINPFAKTLVKYDFDPGSQKLINQMQKAEDVSGRIIAIKKLAEKSGYGNLSAIEKAYKKEAFYGVRCEAVKALTKNASLKARDILVSIIAKENDFRVQTSLMASLIGFKDETISKAVEKRVKKEELGTWASCYAYQVLGSQWENAPTELLNSLAEKKTYKAFDQGGAIKALGLSRNKELLDLIIEKSKYGSSDERTRHFYNESLGYLSKGLEPSDKDKVFKTLLTGLRDPHSKVRSSAVSALGILGETRAIRHLDSYMKDLSVQDKVDIRELIESIQGREKSIEKGLKKQVGDLAQKLKELEEKLEKIKANKKAKKEKKNKDKEDKKAKKEKKEKEKEAKKKKEKKDKKK